MTGAHPTSGGVTRIDSTPGRTGRPIHSLPSAAGDGATTRTVLRGRLPAVFLDYDGTLTPIVRRPELAVLPEITRVVLRRLAERVPVAILSGRDLEDVRSMVKVEGITFAGSHGFDIAGPGWRHERGTEFLPSLHSAERELRTAIEPIPGAWVERKRFAVAVHYREVDESRVPELEQAAGVVAAGHPELRKTGGKKVTELRPAIDWDKGKALLFLLDALHLDRPDVVPLYIGDDETDEDAFRAVRGRGVGIVVAEGGDRTTSADFRLADPDEVRDFLDTIASGDRID